MGANRFTEGSLIVIGQETLEGMSGQQHQVEPPPQPHAAPVCLDPGDFGATGAVACDVQHGPGGIDAPHLAPAPKCRRQQPRAAAQIEYAAHFRGKINAVAGVITPAVLGIIELGEIGILEEPVLHHDWVALFRRIGYSGTHEPEP